ncbi:MAG: hypothetical protein ACYC3F_01110 [Gemmatimonadaceae bacterium]
MTRAEEAARDPGPVDEFGADFWRLVAQELELVACCLTDATPHDVVGIADRLVHVLGLRAQVARDAAERVALQSVENEVRCDLQLLSALGDPSQPAH